MLRRAALMIAHPHDALFKAAFEAPAHAAELSRALLPVELRDRIDWDTMRGESASFVDAKLTDRHGDLLFSVRLRADSVVPLYLLLEHQSTAEPAMPLRTLSYRARIWERFHKSQPAACLPPIITVVVSHVPGGWTAARSFEDLFDPAVVAIPALGALMPRCSLIIDDLEQLSDEDLEARPLAGFPKLALWLLRDGRDPECLLKSFDTWSATMIRVLEAPMGIDAFTALLTYTFRVVGPVNWAALHAKLRHMGPHAEMTAMTIADQLHEEGRMEGRMEGRIDTLRSLLLYKFKLPALDAAYESRLRMAIPEMLDRYLQRALFADTLSAVFEG